MTLISHCDVIVHAVAQMLDLSTSCLTKYATLHETKEFSKPCGTPVLIATNTIKMNLASMSQLSLSRSFDDSIQMIQRDII
jgi:hypothetical protein